MGLVMGIGFGFGGICVNFVGGSGDDFFLIFISSS